MSKNPPTKLLELVLSNQSESEVTATVSGRSLGRKAERRSVSVHLGPRETRVLNLPRVWTLESELGRGAWAAGSLSVTYDGAPSDLVARGMVEDRALRYSGVVEFSDPGAGVGSELHGAGWRLGAFEGAPLVPVLVVRNIADEASTVMIRIPYSESEGATGRLELEPVALEPGEIRDLSAEALSATQNLARLQGVTTGLELTFTGAPGTLLAAAESVSLDGDQVFRVPLIDPQTKGAAGNYPWRVDEDVSTVVYLKNVTSEPRDYTVQLDFEGGSYVLGIHELEPGQSVTIDVGQLRDSQTPDEHDVTIPLDAKAGQVRWSALGAGGQHSMVGRSEYVSAAAGVSSTFACSNCCPDSFYNSFVDPNPGIGLWGDILDLHHYTQFQDCYGIPGTPVGAAGTWIWDDETVPYSGEFYTREVNGVTVWGVLVTYATYYYATYVTGWQCTSQTQEINRPIVVYAGDPSVEITGPSSVSTNDGAVSITTEVHPGGGTLSNWRIVSGDTAAVDPTSLQAGAIRALAPGSVEIQVDYTPPQGDAVTSEPFGVTLTAAPQYVYFQWQSAAEQLILQNFSGAQLSQIKERARYAADTVLHYSTGANVVVTNAVPSVPYYTTISIRGSGSGGAANYDLLNKGRATYGWIYIGSLDLANPTDPAPTETPGLNERRIPSRVADAIGRLAAHEAGHTLGLVARQSELSDPLAVLLNVNTLSLNGTSSHHTSASVQNGKEMVMYYQVNFSHAAAWDLSLYELASPEKTYLDRILP